MDDAWSGTLQGMRDLVYLMGACAMSRLSRIQSKTVRIACHVIAWVIGSVIITLILCGALGVALAAGAIDTMDWLEDKIRGKN